MCQRYVDMDLCVLAAVMFEYLCDRCDLLTRPTLTSNKLLPVSLKEFKQEGNIQFPDHCKIELGSVIQFCPVKRKQECAGASFPIFSSSSLEWWCSQWSSSIHDEKTRSVAASVVLSVRHKNNAMISLPLKLKCEKIKLFLV